MQAFVLVVGITISLLSIVLMVRPAPMLARIDDILSSRWLFLVALLRFLVGAGLIASAPAVGYSGAVTVLGWLFALGGLLLVSVPASLVRRVTTWFTGLAAWQVRLWVLLALALGLFLAFAAIA